MGKTLIIGVGNLIMSDDGFGIHVIKSLQDKDDLPKGVEILDGATGGLDMLYYLEGVSRLIIVDAVEMKKTPGTLTHITGDAIPAYFSLKTSPHEVALPDMLFSAKLIDVYPDEVEVWGVQPENVDLGLDLSPAVAEKVDIVISHIIDVLN